MSTSHNGAPECGKKNQFGDYDDVSNMTTQDWSYRWSKEQTKFHMTKVHPMLKKHIKKVTKGTTKCRFYVPMCGKSLDMKWLADQGHDVVGNECVDEACRQFFKEHNLTYTTVPLSGVDGVLYKAKETSIQIYRCDCFDLSSSLVGKFDCIWDRGGFVALPVKDRDRYAKSILGMMSSNCRYMLDCFLVDNTIFGGPPFNCSEDDVKKYFSYDCKMQKIDTADAFGEWQKNTWGITSFVEEVYMIEPLAN